MTSDPIRLEAELRPAFARLDHLVCAQAAAHLTPQAASDFSRLAIAFGLLATGEGERADAYLSAVEGDGSAVLPDLAYVRAFRAELNNDYEAVVETLRHHLEDGRGTHPGRLRLRLADALLKTKKYQQVTLALGPLLEPPGTEQTLEAQLIVLDGMVQFGTDKEHLIEQVSLLDVLIERGFRLTESPTLVYYAQLLQTARIEPTIGPLLIAHEVLLETFTPESEEEVSFLLSAGNKHKCPSAVRCAGRGYVAQPFAWKDQDPNEVSYLFSTHEEHEAARLTLLNSYPKREIDREQDIWGPLILATYHSGRWRETLELLRKHRVEIAKFPMYENTRMVRAVCEFHLGRHAECLESIAAQGIEFITQASGMEASVEVLALMSLGRFQDVAPAAHRAFEQRKSDGEFLNEYASTVLNEILIRERREGFAPWLDFLASFLRDDVRPATMQRVGELAVEWSLPDCAEVVADQLEALGVGPRAALIRALVKGFHGEFGAAEDLFAQAFEGTDEVGTLLVSFIRARARRRAGMHAMALADLAGILTKPDFPRYPAALAVKAGIHSEEAIPTGNPQAVLREAFGAISRFSRNKEEYTVLFFEIDQLATGDSPTAALAQAESTRRRQPGSVEVLRLARKALHGHGRTAAEEAQARAIVEAWQAEQFEAAR